MRFILSTSFLVMLLLNTINASAKTLIEKSMYGEDLTLLELTAIYRAEMRWCENRSPTFKSKAKSLITQFENFSEYKKMSSRPEFSKLEPEANAYVANRFRNPVEHTCSQQFSRLEWIVQNKKW